MESNDARTHQRRREARCANAVALASVAACILIAFSVAAPDARAQPSHRVTGTVVSEDGEHVVGAQVRVVDAANHVALSDDDGRFEFYLLGDSVSRLVVVRRIGFRPETLTVRVPRPDDSSIEVRMVRSAQLLASVVVEGDASDRMSTSARVHERQKRSGNGRFVYRDEIAQMQVSRTSDVLRRVPGVRITVDGMGRTELRLRGSACAPLFWMNGSPLGDAPFEIDELPPSAIEAIEIYPSAATVPLEFRGNLRVQGCGVIVLWIREGERKQRRASIGADSIARLVDASRVFLPEEVDSVARVLTMPQPEYPDSLYQARVPGSVVAEFIVDASGKIVLESIGVVSSSHERFGDAVRSALREATFRPAVRNGHPVAQVVQLPVTFRPPGEP
jgi:TonB family protein